jgi:hypothetical protein
LLGRKVYYYEAYRGEEKQRIDKMQNKKIVLLLARCHPSESVSNLVLKGFVEEYFREDNLLHGKFLRDHFLFLIIPILNPDGVIAGNSRCSLSGQDLDRVWQQPCRYNHPEVYYAKKLLKGMAVNNEFVFACQFKGNWIKREAFIQGINIPENKRATREFSVLMSEKVDHFDLLQSK